MQIVLDSGILTNRVATGFQATITATNHESTEFNVTELLCKSSLVARVQPTVLFDLEIIMQVLEIFMQGKPSFIDVGREFTFKHGFTITDMFGCSMKIKPGEEYYIFASTQNEFSDLLEYSPYFMDFAVDPNSKSTPANFVQQLNNIKTNAPRCGIPQLTPP